MFRSSIAVLRVSLSILALVCFVTDSFGQIAYGVNSAGTLFRFDTDVPGVVTELGPVGFVPEGIDFRPGTNSLYAIDIGPNTTQLYTLDITNGSPTPVGAGFSSAGTGYDLTGNQSFGFDFNPKTLQPDDSMRIRLVSTNTADLRLNSATGQISNIDGDLRFGNGSSPFVDAVAYINNIPQAGGTTELYDLDSRNDAMLFQNPPNSGTVATVGPFGVTVDALVGMGFDIYTTPGDADLTIGGDFGFAVLRRETVASGAYQLYDVDLATGAISNGALVGPALTPYNFDGGFAVVPEPSAACFLATALSALLVGRRQKG